MHANTKRPWYRLHWGTVLVVFFVGLNWWSFAFPFLGRPIQGAALVQFDGWPRLCMIESPLVGTRDYHWPSLTFNAAVCIACLCSVVFVVERLERSSGRFTSSSGFAAMTVVALMIAFQQWDSEHAEPQIGVNVPGGNPIADYAPIRLERWELQVPIFFALACLAYLLVASTIRGFSNLLSLLPPRSPKDEAAGGRH
jgi:hypothetical protein